MNTNEKCPWDTAPYTIEAMANSILQQHIWETENDRKAPIEWHIILTSQAFQDIMVRVIILEQRVKAINEQMGRA